MGNSTRCSRLPINEVYSEIVGSDLERVRALVKLAAASGFEPLHRGHKSKIKKVIASDKKPGLPGFLFLGSH